MRCCGFIFGHVFKGSRRLPMLPAKDTHAKRYLTGLRAGERVRGLVIQGAARSMNGLLGETTTEGK